MEWVKKELKNKIDFVIWTGDSARHDNDDDLPRNADQVVGLNKLMVDKIFETFGKDNGDEEDDNPNNDYVVPIIPNLGNNDILPHNIFTEGPNRWTRQYAKIWRQFIPEEQRHQFEQGGWFYVEVIPNKLAIFSINTLYFFNNNAATDGCALPSEPGYEQMEWLRIQLQFMRERGMKAILTGHVPPTREESKSNWEETCWQKYTLWLRQYRDVVVSGLYGHFNYDHFILQDFEDLKKGTQRGKMPDYSSKAEGLGSVHAAVSNSYFMELRQRWSELPNPPDSLAWPGSLDTIAEEPFKNQDITGELQDAPMNEQRSSKKKKKHRDRQTKEEKKFLEKIGGPYAERFAASFVSASVVPNLFPTLRVFEYNITGLDSTDTYTDLSMMQQDSFDVTPSSSSDQLELRKKKKKKSHHKKKKKPRYKFTVPDGPSSSAPPGPAYSPQSLSLIRYTQYFANLTYINNDFSGDTLDATRWKEGKHKGKRPSEKDRTPQPRDFKYEVEYDTRDDDVYQLRDLTMPRLVELARRIGDFEAADALPKPRLTQGQRGRCRRVKATKHHKKHKKSKKHKHDRQKQNEAWYAFVRRAFVDTMTPEELEEEFGK